MEQRRHIFSRNRKSLSYLMSQSQKSTVLKDSGSDSTMYNIMPGTHYANAICAQAYTFVRQEERPFSKTMEKHNKATTLTIDWH